MTSSYAVADLLPHAAPMLLLDEVLERQPGQVSAGLLIRPDIPFFVQDKGIPAHIGLEYMAQTCGIYAGIEGLEQGQPVRLGFLLGTRNFHASLDWFRDGDRLIIRAAEILRQDGMGVFDCRILCDKIEVASAQLNLYRQEA